MEFFQLLMRKNIESLIAGFLVAAIAVLVSLQVFLRYFFSISLIWAEEIGHMMVIWFVFLATVTVTKKYDHIKIEMLAHRLRPSHQTILTLVVDALVVLFLVFLVISGYIYAKVEFGALSPVLEIPEGYFVIPIPICASLMIIYRVIGMGKKFNSLLK